MKEMQIYSIKIFLEKYIVEFKCSYKILPSSLKKIAITFKLKNKMPFPYLFSNNKNLGYIGEIPNKSMFNSLEDYNTLKFDILKNEKFNFKEYSINYCNRDVEITAEFVMILNNMLKNFKIPLEKVYSAPSLSFKLFEKHFNNDKIKFRYNFFTHKFIKNAYYGGRCEVYGNPTDEEFIFYYDFSGMYAQCMQEKFPYGKYTFSNEEKDLNKAGFYCIEFTSYSYIPVLPHHELKNNKLLFTNGKMIGFYWFEEIKLFLENGGKIHKILYSITFEKYDYIFNDFVNHFTTIREKGEEYKTFGKLIINSLYGRLGMDIIDKHTMFVKKQDIEYYENKFKILKKKEINNIVLIEVEIDRNFMNESKIKIQRTKSNVGIAAAITAKARIKLFNAQKAVLNNKGRLLYSDTDSVFAAYKKNVIGEKHGDIFWDPSKKDSIIEDAIFINPKTYGLLYKNEEIIKIKGLNKKNISFCELKDKFYNQKNLTIENYEFLSKQNLILENYNTSKTFYLNNYDKRKFRKNFKETEPLTFKNGIYF